MGFIDDIATAKKAIESTFGHTCTISRVAANFPAKVGVFGASDYTDTIELTYPCYYDPAAKSAAVNGVATYEPVLFLPAKADIRMGDRVVIEFPDYYFESDIAFTQTATKPTRYPTHTEVELNGVALG